MNFQKYSLLFFLLIGLLACEPDVDDKPDIGLPPVPSFEIIQGASLNDFILQNTTPGAFLTNWELESNSNKTGETVEINYPFKGEYEVKMTTFNKGGSASTSKILTVTQDDPNACFGNFRTLTGCGEKVWKIAPEANAIHIGPNINDTWWGNSDADITTRSCHWNDRYIFRSNGEFEFNANGDFWADDDGSGNVFPPELGLSIGCHPSSDWPEAFKSWDSGIHSFNISETSLTITGEGAWIGLYKIGTTDEVGVPQSSITYSISEITDDRIVLFTDYGWGVWRVTLVAE